MIKNERQYRVTQTQANKFKQALTQFDQNSNKREEVHPLLWKAQRDALQSQLSDLREELEEYEALKSGKRAVLELESLEELPLALTKARIVAGLSQKELAQRLGLKEQQIQRYEDTKYASASFTRLVEVSQALGINIREDVFLPNAQVSLTTLFGRLREVGIDREFIIKRLLPQSAGGNLQIDNVAEDQAGSLALRAAALLNRVFGLTPTAIFSSSPLQLNTAAMGTVRLMSKRTDERHLSAYTLYAHYLALLVLDATSDLPKKQIPTNPNEVREAILSTYGSLTFNNALHYVWSLGVPVLPLNDSGAFHGAFWRVGGRNVIVLKQQTKSAARWLSDLLHELWHTAQEPELDECTVIEDSEFRLSLQGENWWGTATNLQAQDTDYTDPWQAARDLLLEQVNFGRLNKVDRDLLLRALSDS